MDYLPSVKEEVPRHIQYLKEILKQTSISFISILSEDSEEEEEYVENPDNIFENVSKIPKATLSSSFEFSTLENASENMDFISRSELGVWKLASSLWDDIKLPVDFFELEDDKQAALLDALRKETFSDWLKWDLSSTVEMDIFESVTSSSQKIWIFLVCRKLGLAISEALNAKNFRLATLLAQINGPSSSLAVKNQKSSTNIDHTFFGGPGTDISLFEEIDAQLRIWERTAVPYMDPYLSRIWKLLSGNIELWDLNLFQNLTKWKQFFGVFFWYAQGGHMPIHEVMAIYLSLSSNSAESNAIPKPTPHYFKGLDCKVQDICFSLIHIFVDDSFPLENALNPLNFSEKPLDYLCPWILFLILSRVKNIRDFSDAQVVVTEQKLNSEEETYPVILSVSTKGDLMTTNLVKQLEVLGEWVWAVFVSLFISDHFQREHVVKELLARYYPLDDMSGSAFGDSSNLSSSTWTFLVGQLKVPKKWIHEARALRSRAFDRPVQEAVSLFDASMFDCCHKVVISKIAPISLFSSKIFYF